MHNTLNKVALVNVKDAHLDRIQLEMISIVKRNVFFVLRDQNALATAQLFGVKRANIKIGQDKVIAKHALSANLQNILLT